MLVSLTARDGYYANGAAVGTIDSQCYGMPRVRGLQMI